MSYFLPLKVASADTGDLSAEFTSDTLTVQARAKIAIQTIFSGTGIEGQVWLDKSLDGTNWTKDHNTACRVTGTSEAPIFDILDTAIPCFRVHWTPTAGTGTMTIKTYTKTL